MPSQLEFLKEQLRTSQPRSGSDNPFVQGLRAQIARLEKPSAENPLQQAPSARRRRPLTKL